MLRQHRMDESVATKNNSCWVLLLVALLLRASAASTCVDADAVLHSNKGGLLSADSPHDGTQSSCTADVQAATANAAEFSCTTTGSKQPPFISSVRIPAQLWQTSRSSNVSRRAKTAMESWHTLNPSLTATLHNDTAAAHFIRTVYGEVTFDIFRSFPLGVMRADFWRYAVLYAYGGIYADVDTQCVRPLQQWFPPRKQFPNELKNPDGIMFVSSEDGWHSAGELDYHKISWGDCSIVIALENRRHFCQWVIASVAGHPILNEVIHLILARAKQGFNVSDEHMVHYHTGPAIWTEAILNVLGLQGLNATAAATAVWTDPAAYSKARSLGVCVVAASFWGTRYAQNTRHMYGSLNFKEQGYPRWREERNVLLGHPPEVLLPERAAEHALWWADGIGLPEYNVVAQGSAATDPEFW